MDITELSTGFQSYSAEELEGALPTGKVYDVFTMNIPVSVAEAHGDAWGEWVRDKMLEKHGFDMGESYYSEEAIIDSVRFYRYLQRKEVPNG